MSEIDKYCVLHFFNFGRIPLYLQIIDNITSSAPPPIDSSLLSLNKYEKIVRETVKLDNHFKYLVDVLFWITNNLLLVQAVFDFFFISEIVLVTTA